MTGLRIGLQTQVGTPYDTGRYRSGLYLAASTVMTETGVGDTPLADRASPTGDAALESTFALVERAKTGDREALDRLFARFLPSLRRWASGRLPRWTRDLMDTDDLVQETVMRARQPDRSIRVAARRRAAGVSAPGDRQPHPRRDPSRQAIADRDAARRQRRRPRRVAARDRDRRRSARALRIGARAPAARRARSHRRADRDGWHVIRTSRARSASRPPMRRGWRSAARCCASPRR